MTQSAPAAMALVMSPEYLMPPSAISGTPVSRVARATLRDGGDLRHARAADHARGADRTRPDADLDAIHAQLDQIPRAFIGRDIAGDQLHVRAVALLQVLHGVHHALAVAVRGIDGQHIHLHARPAPARAPGNRPSRRAPRRTATGPARPWPRSGTSSFF